MAHEPLKKLVVPKSSAAAPPSLELLNETLCAADVQLWSSQNRVDIQLSMCFIIEWSMQINVPLHGNIFETNDHFVV